MILANRKILSATGKKGRSPLHTAVKGEQVEVVKLLLKSRVDINAKSGKKDFERTPLHYAIIQGNFEICDLLIQHQASVAAKDSEGNPSLNLAIQGNHADIVALLCKKRADVDGSKSKVKPLHLAAQINSVAMFQLLLSLKAKMEIKSGGDDDDTVGHVAAFHGSLDILKLLQTKRMGKMLSDAKNKQDQTCLHKACLNGHLECARFLVEKCGAKTNVNDKKGQTPFSLGQNLAKTKPQNEQIRNLARFLAEKYGEGK